VEQIADLNAAADEVVTRRVDVGDDQLQPLNGAGLVGGDALPYGDRALRVGGVNCAAPMPPPNTTSLSSRHPRLL
jgi:hypothetical protein